MASKTGGQAARSPLSSIQIFTLSLLIALSACAVDVILPAITQIGSALNTSVQSAQLVVTAYLLGFAGGQLPVGLAADRYGRRGVILACVAIFILASIACTLAPSIEMLLLARFIQGLAGAVGPVLSRAIVRDHAGADGGAGQMATLTAILGLAPLVAPIIGSALMQLIDWRATMAFCALYGLLTWGMSAKALPVEQRTARTLGAGAQLKASIKAFFGTPQCWICAVLIWLPFCGYTPVLTTTSALVIDGYGLSDLAFIILFAIVASGYSIGAILAREMMKRRSPLWVLQRGCWGMGVTGLALLAIVAAPMPPLWLLWPVITLYLIAFAAVAPVATSFALAPLTGSAGFGAAVIGALQITMGVLASFASAILYDHSENSMCLVIGLAGVLSYGFYVVMRARFAGWFGNGSAGLR